MNANFHDSGIRAIHSIIVCHSHSCLRNTSPQTLASILDHSDILGCMLMDDFRDYEGWDTALLFRLHLQNTEDKFEGFQGLTQAFDENMSRTKTACGCLHRNWQWFNPAMV